MSFAIGPMDKEILVHLANTYVLTEEMLYALLKDRYSVSLLQLRRRLDELVDRGYLVSRGIPPP